MSVDLKYLKSQGVSAAAYKKIWTLERAKQPKNIRKLNDLLTRRNQDGIDLNLQEWRAYAAIDYAYEVPFNQTTPTLVHSLMSRCGPDGKGLSPEEIRTELASWGLSESALFKREVLDNGQQGPAVLDVPVLFQIFIPIVKSYVTAVCARLFNERNTVPLMPYKPLNVGEEDVVLCQVVTDWVNKTATNYGYAATLRQAILQCLKYATVLAFPREQWHKETQEDEDGRYIVREGIRYIMPDPTRMFYDLSYPLSSINTDTGCEFAGHWRVDRYSTVLDNQAYWNRERIAYGTNWFSWQAAGSYFKEFFPCTLKFPSVQPHVMNREDKFAFYNSTNDRDKALFVTDLFCKINPRRWGLADYNHMLWHRFVMAGDETVVYCEPFPYTPVWFMGCDYDENAGKNDSLALDLIPWQDMVGQVLTQMVLTAQQNLQNLVFYDTEMVNVKDVQELEKKGHGRYSKLNLVPYSSHRAQRAGINMAGLFVPVTLPRSPITEFLQLMSTVLNLMERVLNISAQETGGSASHQQSKAEVTLTDSAVAIRRKFTGSYVDEAIDAWQNQLYLAHMAFADPSVTAQVSSDVPNLNVILKKLGFEVMTIGRETWVVRGDKRILDLDGFAKRNNGPDLGKDREIAQIIFQLVGTVAGQPALFGAVGVKTIVSMLEMAAKLAGVPGSFRIPLGEQKNGEVDPQTVEAIKQAAQGIMQQVGEQVAKPAAEASAKSEAEIQQLQQALKQLQPLVAKAAQQTDANQIKAAETAHKIQLEDAEFQAEQRRKEEAHRLDMKQQVETTTVKTAIQAAESAARVRATDRKE